MNPACLLGSHQQGGAIYFGTYVDDCLYFSTDDETEAWFERELSARVTIDFMGPASWYLGACYDWSITEAGRLSVHLSQEGCIHNLLDKWGMEKCKPAPTPYHSGLVTDRVPYDNFPLEEKADLIKQYGSLVGALNWLSVTRHHHRYQSPRRPTQESILRPHGLGKVCASLSTGQCRLGHMLHSARPS